MSFTVGGITFYEPSDHTLISSLGGFDSLWGYVGNVFVRVDKSLFSPATHTMHSFVQVTGLTSNKLFASGNTMRLGVANSVLTELNPDYLGGALLLRAYNRILFYGYSATTVSTFQNMSQVYTWPVGYPCTVSADSFVQYSMKRVKTDIKEIPDVTNKLKQLSVKEYKIKDKKMYGFLVDENPSDVRDEFIHEREDSTQETIQGVNIVSLLAIVAGALQDIERRLAALEKKGG